MDTTEYKSRNHKVLLLWIIAWLVVMWGFIIVTSTSDQGFNIERFGYYVIVMSWLTTGMCMWMYQLKTLAATADALFILSGDKRQRIDYNSIQWVLDEQNSMTVKYQDPSTRSFHTIRAVVKTPDSGSLFNFKPAPSEFSLFIKKQITNIKPHYDPGNIPPKWKRSWWFWATGVLAIAAANYFFPEAFEF